MDNADFDRRMKLADRNVTFFANIRIIIVRDGFGQTVNIIDAKRLTTAWLTMSNDAFFEKYGFSWVPPLWLQDEVRRNVMQHAARGGRYGA